MTTFLGLRDAVAARICHGDVVAMEGSTRLIPRAAGRGAVVPGWRDLKAL